MSQTVPSMSWKLVFLNLPGASNATDPTLLSMPLKGLLHYVRLISPNLGSLNISIICIHGAIQGEGI